jgi:hypothetical protein
MRALDLYPMQRRAAVTRHPTRRPTTDMSDDVGHSHFVLRYVLDFVGGRTRTRTLDPLIKSPLAEDRILAQIRSNRLLRRRNLLSRSID